MCRFLGARVGLGQVPLKGQGAVQPGRERLNPH